MCVFMYVCMSSCLHVRVCVCVCASASILVVIQYIMSIMLVMLINTGPSTAAAAAATAVAALLQAHSPARSPGHSRRTEHSACVPLHPFSTRKRDYSDVARRYSRLSIPDDLVDVQLRWPEASDVCCSRQAGESLCVALMFVATATPPSFISSTHVIPDCFPFFISSH